MRVVHYIASYIHIDNSRGLGHKIMNTQYVSSGLYFECYIVKYIVSFLAYFYNF